MMTREEISDCRSLIDALVEREKGAVIAQHAATQARRALENFFTVQECKARPADLPKTETVKA